VSMAVARIYFGYGGITEECNRLLPEEQQIQQDALGSVFIARVSQ